MIFYFSGTGNTRWAAFKLASATKERLVCISDYVREVKRGNKKNEPFILQEGERLGFVFPVHGWRVPRLVRSFLQGADIRLANEGGKRPFAYAVCTAGDSIGKTIDNLNEVIADNPSLKAMGVERVASAYSLIMPESYVGLPFMDVDTKERETAKKTKAAQELEIICEEVAERKEGVSRLTKGILPWFMTTVIGGFFENVLITDKRFHVEKERCVRCGICANVCPVADIEGGKGKYPSWLHHDDCLTCFSCYHHCPHHAIEFGHQTQKKGQYYYK